MLRHNYRLLGWEQSLTGAVVDTMWVCTNCRDQRVWVTPDDWKADCPGPPEEVIEVLAEEAEEGYDPSKPREPRTEDE